MLTQAAEDYLKSIYKLQEKGGKVSTGILAEYLDVKPASATGMIKKLKSMNLVSHERYQGVTLTEAGKAVALEIIRHHRLLELYLFKALGVPWDGVHEEAEKLEHVISEDVEARMDEFLGYPTVDPHGSPIPDKNGVVPKTPSIPMTDLQNGQACVVAEVSDNDSAILRHLGGFNLYPGTAFRVIEVAPFEGPFTIDVAGQQVVIGREVAKNIFVNNVQETDNV
ncbi:MAG: metal-dependent transcriptional regulator [Candidatus Poribacteria bacterium]|nr:metal-dependent transcriptional regulator [Candidatus Poribacteria bacterium]MDE0314118.1 metal-dependent transcriptional regulator [Candidatus Poribacteria bacterium]